MSLFFIVFGVGTYNTSHALPRDTVLTYIMLLGCVSIKISGGANIFNIINVSGGASIDLHTCAHALYGCRRRSIFPRVGTSSSAAAISNIINN